VVFVPVDFERQSLAHELHAAGFRVDQPAWFSWLGVVPYLTEAAFRATLAVIAAMPLESGVVFDYALDPVMLDPTQRLAFDALAARVARAGEPFQLFFDPAHLAEQLRGAGFRPLQDLGAEELNARYFLDSPSDFRVRGSLGRLVSARI
jgi:methyltransferase (TIGR00027 family)